MSGRGDVGADEPEDKTMKVMCQLKNCWVSWAGEWELLWLIRWGMRIAVEGRDMVLKIDSFFNQERW